MIIKKYLVAAALCLGLSTHAFADEKVTNGTFNGSLNAWNFSSSVSQGLSQVANRGIIDTVLPGSNTLTQSLSLSAGTYKLDFSGFFIGRNTTIDYSIAGLVGRLTGSQIGGSHSFEFDVTGPTASYLLSFTGFARGAFSFAAVDNVSVSSVTAVPGPEAGAGLGALAMAGMAVWARRRRVLQQQNS